MKKFKEFLENYDVYIDKPMGWENITVNKELRNTNIQNKLTETETVEEKEKKKKKGLNKGKKGSF
jgi:hypothetical protein